MKKVKKDTSKFKAYFRDHSKEKLAILDETPREVVVGERFYLLKPLKYRQYTRLCILFAKTLEKLNKKNIDLTNADSIVGELTENLEHEFFMALAYILYFARNIKEENEYIIKRGLEEEYEYIKDNATLDQLSNVLIVISMQNDIDSALKSFGILGKKKIVQ